jgi:hypothetical protein
MLCILFFQIYAHPIHVEMVDPVLFLGLAFNAVVVQATLGVLAQQVGNSF